MNIQDPQLWSDFQILLDGAIREDLADIGDISSQAIFTNERSRARIFARERGVVSGLMLVEACFQALHRDEHLGVLFHAVDGDKVDKEALVMEISGYTADLLKAERIALNFLGYFSGIATKAKAFSAVLVGTSIQILDTRKTLPAYRRLAKAAVIDGSAHNHRMGLYDTVLIKENHITAAGGIRNALQAVHSKWNRQYCIILECSSIEEVDTALSVPRSIAADRIILDNMSVEEAARAVTRIRGSESRPSIEASGNFDIEKLKEYSHLDIDYISVGALTHSVRTLDFSMLIE